MKPTEAAALLTICAAYDNRKPDPDAAKAWSLALDGLRFEDCRDAIVAHYRASREWIMPADVITAVKRLRSSRLEDAAPLSPPPGLDPDDTEGYSRWLAATRAAIADGRPPTEVAYEATRSIGELGTVLRSLPRPDPPKATDTRGKREHAERLEAARAELAARPPVPMPDEPEPEESA